MKILLTGATGFVGGALLPKLLQNGHYVRCLVRKVGSVPETSGETLEVKGDVRDFTSIRNALSGCDAAYYLIHSMDGDGDYREQDRQCARIFAEAAADAGISKIIYVSGLADEGSSQLSDHLASRLEVGKILRCGSVPCVELRAAMIIGKHSLSFRMVENLCRRLPIMICPRWLSTLTQPIAIGHLLTYMVSSLELPNESVAIEIGGSDRLTYMEILRTYCRIHGLRRMMIPVPLLTPRLSALWLGLVTPETAKVGRAMIDGLRNPTFVQSDSSRRLFDFQPISVHEAIVAASRESGVSIDGEENERVIASGGVASRLSGKRVRGERGLGGGSQKESV